METSTASESPLNQKNRENQRRVIRLETKKQKLLTKTQQTIFIICVSGREQNLFTAAAFFFFFFVWPILNMRCCPAGGGATLHNLCFTHSLRSAAFPSQYKLTIKSRIRSTSRSESLSTRGNVQKLSKPWQKGWQHTSLIDQFGPF